MNKRAYLITPIIFITLFLIAVIFTLYLSKIDASTAAGIRISASIEKGVTDVYKSQNEQINYAKLSAYACSKTYCYNLTDKANTNKTNIENCVNQSLNDQYGNLTWGPSTAFAPVLSNVSTTCYINFNLSSVNLVNITNINMDSDRVYTKAELNSNFFEKC